MSSFVNLLSSPARTSFKELFLGGPILGSVSASAFRDLFLGFTVAREISPLQEKTQELAKKMGVTIPVRAVEQSRFSWAAHGCVFFGLAHISVPSDLVDSVLHTAILAHEIAHIKLNDCFWMFRDFQNIIQSFYILWLKLTGNAKETHLHISVW